MSRLIDADAFLRKMNLAIVMMKHAMTDLDCEDDPEFVMELKAYQDIRQGIKDEPTVELKQKTGKFIGIEYDGYADGNPVFCEWKCSECGCVFEDEEPTYNFCPNCGSFNGGGSDDQTD